MASIKSQKKELAEKIAKKRGLKVATAEYRSMVKGLMNMSYPNLIKLNK